MFEIESEESLPDFRQCPYDNELSSMNISEDQIDKIINKLNAAKSQGPDNLHTKLLKETKSVIKKPLKMILQKSIDEGKLPEVWKLANSTPIFKKGSKEKQKIIDQFLLHQYRVKILERCIRDAIVKHMTP